MEAAFDDRAFAMAILRNNQTLARAMTAISILAMAMVISLFGGYVDSPNDQRDQHSGPDYLPEHSFTKPQ